MATSPASSGPAGSQFEAQVGAHYLLSMLVGTEPRGLPGTTIARVKFQRAAEGHPLDDVIVEARDYRGQPAVLEIQVKRTITFTAGDTVFRDAVAQIADATRRPDFWIRRHHLAIATSRSSRKIDGAYQDVLTWARQIGDAATFTARINRPGSANEDMRTFVRTFASRLAEAGAANDDETVWKLLRRLQILVFDFTAPGSASAELALERATRVLHPDDMGRAGSLWTDLEALAIDVAASGGDRTKDELGEHLRQKTFRLTGDRRYATARAALAEASRHALADIRDRVGTVLLTRHERTTAVHTALDSGRYLEIRGDAGVGKSGLLKHVAEQISAEGQVFVLSPGRVTPGGWTAMKSVLGFDGSAHELLSDLAGDGGVILFLDNLDFFSEAERTTVVDIVREASGVPGLAVVATARRNFGTEEPNWLPSEALAALGRTEPIVIGDLSDAEVDELRNAAPQLVPILDDAHPARDVIRNLFRLSRLAIRPESDPVPRTECDMAAQWWQTADGNIDAEHRVRARLLRALAVQVIEHGEPLDVRDQPPGAVDALVSSESLRDLSDDHVAYRHDVLREWAIANLLHAESATIDHLPLDRPAPAALSRGLELAARMAIERVPDSTHWQLLLDRLSRDGVHGSWRRAVLLALVRSEIAGELLARASGYLFANRASVLRELIRTLMAVDVEPASRFFAAFGIDASGIPASITVPNNASWRRLIGWLLSLGQSLPPAAIPSVVDLYTGWSTGMFGRDPLTPILVERLYRWLTELEISLHPNNFSDRREPFNGEIEYDRMHSLESDVRTGFLMFCNRAPQLAVQYLEALKQRRHGERIVAGILKFRGSLAQAAPAELAELTADALIPKPRSRDSHESRDLDGPFDYLDHEFFPASPSQGPFLDLLTHAPEQGKSLIHQLVNHTISFYSHGQDHGDDAITIPLTDGARPFPWQRTYVWSREGSSHNSVTSALMALEAWAHRRIEAGEGFESILADVLGPPNSCAAFLLVAVDLILSHWPASREAAVPFVACPELLYLDRERHTHDNFDYPDLFGFKALQKEPAGAISLEALKKRPSRRVMLDRLLDHYAVGRPEEQRQRVEALLRDAVSRLGAYTAKSTLRDPAFMAAHALNRIDPANHSERTVTLQDGTQRTGSLYESPPTERDHFAALQSDVPDRLADTNMQAALGNVLDDASKSSAKLAAVAAAWGQSPVATTKKQGADDDWMREQAVFAAALVVMRDGDAELRRRHATWARDLFAQALQSKDDPVHRVRAGLRFNPIAMAFAGMIHSLREQCTPVDVRALLEIAARNNPAAAHGLGAATAVLASVDDRLPRAILRCAFTASIQLTRKWDRTEEAAAVLSAEYRQRVSAAVDAEMRWLAGERGEPTWPPFPSKTPRRRRRIRLPGGPTPQENTEPKPTRPGEYADEQAAALWLRQIFDLTSDATRSWLRDIARTYASWTAEANGSGLAAHDDVDDPPREWNDAYFGLVARCLPGLTQPEAEALSVTAIAALPDESFFDLTTDFLRAVDAVYFNDGGLAEPIAVGIRSALASRIMASHGWQRLRDNRSSSIEWHIGPAIAVLFFNNYSFIPPPTCYLYAKGVDQIDGFLPTLTRLIASGPSLFVALVTLNLMEVSTKPAHLPFVVAAAKVWLDHYSDDSTFWVDHGIGSRVCLWVEKVHKQAPELLENSQPIRRGIDGLLAALVTLGVADARRLEEDLSRT